MLLLQRHFYHIRQKLRHVSTLRWAIRYSLLSSWPTCVPQTLDLPCVFLVLGIEAAEVIGMAWLLVNGKKPLQLLLWSAWHCHFSQFEEEHFFFARFFSIFTIFVDKIYHFQTQFDNFFQINVDWTFPSCVWKAPGKHIGCLHRSSLSSDSIESFLICFVCLPLRREMIHP